MSLTTAIFLSGAAVGGVAVAGAGQPAAKNMPAPGTAEHEDAEKAVTGDTATKAQAAAVKGASGGTAGEVTTDYFGDGYEVTVTKSDGSEVEIHLDKSFDVMGPSVATVERRRLPAPSTSRNTRQQARAGAASAGPETLQPLADMFGLWT